MNEKLEINEDYVIDKISIYIDYLIQKINQIEVKENEQKDFTGLFKSNSLH